jgi:hypothetical protein
LASWAFTRRATDSGLVPSMGSVGDCFDNAMMERSGPACRSSCWTGSRHAIDLDPQGRGCLGEVAMQPVRTILTVVFTAAVAVTGCSAHPTADPPSATPASPVTAAPLRQPPTCHPASRRPGPPACERTVGTTTAVHLDLLVWASRFGTQQRWASKTAGTCPRLEAGPARRRPAGRAGPTQAHGPRPHPPAPTASPSRSTRRRWRGRRCENPSWPPPGWTAPPTSCGCWSTTATIWSRSGPASSTGCASTCMSSTPPSRHPPGRCRAPSPPT